MRKRESGKKKMLLEVVWSADELDEWGCSSRKENGPIWERKREREREIAGKMKN